MRKEKEGGEGAEALTPSKPDLGFESSREKI